MPNACTWQVHDAIAQYRTWNDMCTLWLEPLGLTDTIQTIYRLPGILSAKDVLTHINLCLSLMDHLNFKLREENANDVAKAIAIEKNGLKTTFDTILWTK